MQLLVVGLNHNSAPVEIRERVAAGMMQTESVITALHNHVDGGIVLSTCNRTEVYAIGDDCPPTEQKAKTFLSTASLLNTPELSPYLYTHSQEDAVRHLFKVASGLDSMIIGEYEILGQVKEALGFAEKTGYTPPPLLGLFRQSVAVGRRTRDETDISRNAASVSSASVEMAKKIFPDLSTCKVLVIGAGEAGRLTTQALLNNGVSEILVASRSFENAAQLAAKIGSGAIPMRSIEEALATSDIVVSCTNSPHYVLEPSAVQKAMNAHRKDPLVIIDIAVPRDVAPQISAIENVFLHDIDDLTAVSQSNLQQREDAAEKALLIVDDEVSRFMSWWNSLDTVPTIVSLVNKAESIRRERLEKTLYSLNGIPEDQRSAIEAMTKSIVRRILHDPILYLKNNTDSAHEQLVRDLFDLKDGIQKFPKSTEED